MSSHRKNTRKFNRRRLSVEQLEARRLMTVSPDAFEENDSIAHAADLGSIAGLRFETDLSIHGNIDGSDNPDFFRFRMTETGGDDDRVEVRFAHQNGDIDLRLRDAAGDILERSLSVTDDEVVSLAQRPPGEYVVEVYGWANATNHYDLLVQTAQARGDAFEPNESASNATELGALLAPRQWSGLNIHAEESGNDRDFFRFTTTATGGRDDHVELRFEHASGDIDMRLLDADGNVLERSLSVTDNERVSLNGRSAGEYVVEVYGWNGAVNSYTLHVDPPEAISIPEDRFEPNDSVSSATTLGSITGRNSWTDLTIHEILGNNNRDHYRFELAAPGEADNYVQIAFEHENGDLDMRLLDGSGQQVASSAGWDDSERITLDGVQAGSYVLEVYGYRDATNSYSLTIDGPEQRTVSADSFEPNDSQSAAHALGIVHGSIRLSDLSIHRVGDEANPDFFQFQTSAVGTPEDYVEISFEHEGGDLDMVLFDADGNRLDSSTSITNDERISLQGRPAGSYVVRVYGYDNAANDYSLTVFAAEPTNESDAFESNDSLASASDLRTIEGTLDIDSLNIHEEAHGGANPDYFRFELGAEGHTGNFVGINFSHSEGDLDLELLNVDGERLDASVSVTNNERISLNGLPSGEYYAHVYGYSNATAEYSLHFDAPYVEGLPPDLFEENNSFATATDLREVTTRQALLDVTLHEAAGQPDVDFYRFELVAQANTGHYVDAEFTHAELNIDIELYDDSFREIRNSRTTTDNERISLAGLGPGVYYARVAGAGAGQAVYDFFVRGPRTSGIPTDNYEPNDTAGTATNLRTIEGQRRVTELTIHADNRGAANDDYFRFETLATGGPNDYVGIAFDDSIGNLDMVLLDDIGRVVDRSQTHSDNEQISLANVEAGVYYVRVVGRLDSTAPYELTVMAPSRRPTSDFELTLRFTDNGLSATQQAVFETAAQRWAEVIIADIPDVRLPTRFFGDLVVDDLLIDVSAPAIDGPNGILGQAGPVVVRRGSNLPAYGIMQFDSADLEQLEREGQLQDVILHEMGHVLGIGTIWEANELVHGIGGANPQFHGQHAREEYGALRLTAPQDVPVENRGGQGTRDSHWRESTFDHELMTGILDRGQNPLSRLTIAQMRDLGYVVDMSAADEYQPPFAALAADEGFEPIELHDDVLHVDPIYIDAGEIDIALTSIAPDSLEGSSTMLRADSQFASLTLHNPQGFAGYGDSQDRFEFSTSGASGEHDQIHVVAHDPRWPIQIDLQDGDGVSLFAQVTNEFGEASIALDGLDAGDYTLIVDGEYNRYSLDVDAPFASETLDSRPQLDGVSTLIRQSSSLTWSAMDDAFSYELQIDDLTSGISNWVETTTTSPEWRPDSPLEPHEYRVRVRVLDEHGNASAWSEYQHFEVISDRFNEDNEVDVNNDGAFNIIDAMGAIDYFRSVVAQRAVSEEAFGVAYVDVDNSGQVSIQDVMTIIDSVRQQFFPIGAGDISGLPEVELDGLANQLAALRMAHHHSHDHSHDDHSHDDHSHDDHSHDDHSHDDHGHDNHGHDDHGHDDHSHGDDDHDLDSPAAFGAASASNATIIHPTLAQAKQQAVEFHHGQRDNTGATDFVFADKEADWTGDLYSESIKSEYELWVELNTTPTSRLGDDLWATQGLAVEFE